MELFGLRLKALRQGKSLTQEQLGGKLGIVGASVSGYEKGISYPSVEALIELCRYFNVSADYLIGLADDAMQFRLSALTDEQVLIVLSIINQFEQISSEQEKNTSKG